VAVGTEQVARGGQGVEKASDLRARARRSGSERESYGLIGEGTANEVTVERERIGPTGWTRTCTCGRRPPRERDQRSRRAPASGARPGRWQDEGSSRLHSGLSLQHADPTVEKFRRRAATPNDNEPLFALPNRLSHFRNVVDSLMITANV